MPINEERDDLKPSLKTILELRNDPNQATKTLSTAKQAVANEVNKILKPFGIELKNDELIIKTSVGEIIEKAPVAYQIINGKGFVVSQQFLY